MAFTPENGRKGKSLKMGEEVLGVARSRDNGRAHQGLAGFIDASVTMGIPAKSITTVFEICRN